LLVQASHNSFTINSSQAPDSITKRTYVLMIIPTTFAISMLDRASLEEVSLILPY